MIDIIINEFNKRNYKYRAQQLAKKYPGFHLMETKINGYSLLVVPDTTIGNQILIKNAFEKSDTDFLSRYIKKDFTIIDIGSNIGYYTMLFARLAANGRVFAVDPLECHENMLLLSGKINRFTNIDFERCAISDSEGALTFCENDDGALSSIEAPGIEGIKIEVKSTTLDKYISKKNIEQIDLIKVDVEGAEPLLINGAKDLLSEKKSKILMIEMCPGNLSYFNSSVKEIDAAIKNYGYEGYFIKENALKKFNSNAKIKSINVFYFSSADILEEAKKSLR